MKKKIRIITNKGFTLIELLVVIAIIGILSTVVIASLNSARTKGQEASIKSTLKNMIAQAELVYDGPGNYSSVCGDTKIASMITSINNSGGTAKCYSTIMDPGKRWAVSARLNSDNTKNWTVDSTGVATWDTSDPSGGSTMDWNTAVTTCKNLGGRLPTMEQIISLNKAYNGLPPGFESYFYWSGTTVDSDTTLAYQGNPADGGEDTGGKIYSDPHVRCIR